MILDSSAIVAIALNEPERPRFIDEINAAPSVAVAAPTLVEAGIVLSARTGIDATELLEAILGEADIAVVEFGAAHWEVAIGAWRRFGKGRHMAGLNFGDCVSYATARVANRPLLAKGDDFIHTDIELA